MMMKMNDAIGVAAAERDQLDHAQQRLIERARKSKIAVHEIEPYVRKVISIAQKSDPIQSPRAAKTKKSAASANGIASVIARLHVRTISRSRPIASSGGTSSCIGKILVHVTGQRLRTRFRFDPPKMRKSLKTISRDIGPILALMRARKEFHLDA